MTAHGGILGRAHVDAPSVDENVRCLFESFVCRNLRLRNRIVMAPMTRWRSPEGVPGEDVIEYYGRRADGGVGLIVTEGVMIDHPGAAGYDNIPAMYGAAPIKAWERLVKRVHASGAAIAPQLWHVGAFRRPGVGPYRYALGYGPHQVKENGTLVVKRLSAAELRRVVRSYGRAARTAVDIGFDAIEIHGAHGYLLDQFLWSKTNRRGDRYGGSIERRARLAAEVVDEIRHRIPRAIPIIFRFSQWKMHDYAARLVGNPDELAAMLRPLSEAGVDIFHVSTRRFWEAAFPPDPTTLARWTRLVTGKPTIAVGSVGLDRAHESRALSGHRNVAAGTSDITRVLTGFKAKDFDLIAIGRALLANPDWAEKVRAGQIASLCKLEQRHIDELI